MPSMPLNAGDESMAGNRSSIFRFDDHEVHEREFSLTKAGQAGTKNALASSIWIGRTPAYNTSCKIPIFCEDDHPLSRTIEENKGTLRVIAGVGNSLGDLNSAGFGEVRRNSMKIEINSSRLTGPIDKSPSAGLGFPGLSPPAFRTPLWRRLYRARPYSRRRMMEIGRSQP